MKLLAYILAYATAVITSYFIYPILGLELNTIKIFTTPLVAIIVVIALGYMKKKRNL